MTRPIDHLVLACRDLDMAAETWRRMGFTVGAQNRHSWGTLNRIVQLDGAFLELITTEPKFRPPRADDPAHPFAGFIDRYISTQGEGFAMLVLRSADAAADAGRLQAAGIGRSAPFFFERKGRRPDGSEVHVAFTLAFAAAPRMAEAGFFLCQQHFPENFWNAEMQRHANAARSIGKVMAIANDPAAHAGFVADFAAGERRFAEGRISIDTGGGSIEIAGPRTASQDWADAIPQEGEALRLAGFEVATRDLAATRAALTAGGIAFSERGAALVVGPAAAHGVAVRFVSAC